MKINTAQDYADGICIRQNPKNGLIKEALIEFAKLHIEACKKDIKENVKTKCHPIEDVDIVDLKSIDKAYPLENIK